MCWLVASVPISGACSPFPLYTLSTFCPYQALNGIFWLWIFDFLNFWLSSLTIAALACAEVGKAPQARNVQSLGSWKPARNFCSSIPRGMKSLQRKNEGDHFLGWNVIDLNLRCFSRHFKMERAVLEMADISVDKRWWFQMAVLQYNTGNCYLKKEIIRQCLFQDFRAFFVAVLHLLYVCGLFSERAGY